jgi:hypothetical protein
MCFTPGYIQSSHIDLLTDKLRKSGIGKAVLIKVGELNVLFKVFYISRKSLAPFRKALFKVIASLL